MKHKRHFSTEEFYKDDENAINANMLGLQLEEEYGVEIEIYHDESVSSGQFGIHQVVFYLSLSGIGIFIGAFLKKLGEKAADSFWLKIKECFNRICKSRRRYWDCGYSEFLIIVSPYGNRIVKIIFELTRETNVDSFFSSIKKIIRDAEKLLRENADDGAETIIYLEVVKDTQGGVFDLSVRRKRQP